MNQKIIDFLKSQQPKLCVLSTATKSAKPESAVVGYAVRDDLTIVISTTKGTRKYNNLKENNQVSFVTGWAFNTPDVQIDGIATIIEEGPEYQVAEEFFFSQNPDAAKFKSSKTIFIQFKPTWIRMLDLTVNPPHTEESFV